ncbi:MAG: arginase family protein [Chitinophagaceae bacterium]
MSIHTIIDFLEPINRYELSNDEGYKDTQLGKHILVYEEEFPDVTDADLVLIGCGEMRGMGGNNNTDAPNAVRAAFYELYYWHKEVIIADVGNIKVGATIQDSYAALKTVASELIDMGKKVVILGGSHDVTLAQYGAYAHLNKIIE